MPSQALTRLGGTGLRRGATRTRSQASTVAAHDGGHLGRCQLPLATDLGASVPSQSGGDGRRVTKDGEDPGGRPRGAGEPSQQLLGQEGGGQCAGGVLDPDSPCTLLAKTEPRDTPHPPSMPSPRAPRSGTRASGRLDPRWPPSHPPAPTHRSAGLRRVPAAPGLAAKVGRGGG